jgi:hypothetical protein
MQWAGLALLIAAQLLVVAPASSRLSPATDEPAHLRSGMAMLTHGRFVDPAKWWTVPDKLHPPADMLDALAARAVGQTPDFRADPFVPFRSIRAARWVGHLFGALAMAVAFAWARRLWGGGAGLMAAALLALNPFFLGNAVIVGTDMTMAAGGLVAAWALWRLFLDDARWARAWGRRFWRAVILAGAALGFAIACKSSNLMLLAAAPVATLGGAWLDRRAFAGQSYWKSLARGLAAAAVTGGVALALAAAAYGFMGLHKAPFMLFGRRWSLPLGQELASCVAWTLTLGDNPPSVFYKGWLQHPSPKHYIAAFIYKTPLPWLALLGLGCGVAARLARGRRLVGGAWTACLCAGIAGYFATRGFYFGLRHLLLPIVLATAIAGAVAGHAPDAARALPRVARWAVGMAVGLLLLWNAAVVARAWPWMLSYFNPLAGDRLILVGPDLDWGQGLVALADWQRANAPSEPLWLSYCGPSRPEDFGVRYRGLLSPYAPGVRLDPAAVPGHDLDRGGSSGPGPTQLNGWVALSATQLAGIHMWSAGRTNAYYAQWLARRPAAKIAGGSIWIYDCRKR